jgi:hypothetical protein
LPDSSAELPRRAAKAIGFRGTYLEVMLPKIDRSRSHHLKL